MQSHEAPVAYLSVSLFVCPLRVAPFTVNRTADMTVLGRDKRWLSHMRKHLADFMRTTIFMNIVPRFMKP